MEQVLKHVKFDQWCESCKYAEADENSLPCNDCLAEPVNEYSTKPVKWVERNSFE